MEGLRLILPSSSSFCKCMWAVEVDFRLRAVQISRTVGGKAWVEL